MTQHTLDWSLCKPGSKIVMDNGDRLTVVKYLRDADQTHLIGTAFGSLWFGMDGEGVEHRIAEIVPPPEPVKVRFYISQDREPSCMRCNGHTHRIAFSLIDGQPDCTSITMEAL